MMRYLRVTVLVGAPLPPAFKDSALFPMDGMAPPLPPTLIPSALLTTVSLLIRSLAVEEFTMMPDFTLFDTLQFWVTTVLLPVT